MYYRQVTIKTNGKLSQVAANAVLGMDTIVEDLEKAVQSTIGTFTFQVEVDGTMVEGTVKRLLVTEEPTVKEECFKCSTFNPNARTAYRCAVPGHCPGIDMGFHKKERILYQKEVAESVYHREVR